MTLHPSSIILILTFAACFAAGLPHPPRPTGFSASFPITRRARSGLVKRQGSQSGSIGLGDAQDNAYSVQITVDSVSVPVILDTGSADLWTITTDCSASSCGESSGSTPKISASSLKPSGIDIELKYGDSAHATSASGTIGSGTVSMAGLQLNDQFLAAVNNTNTSLSDQNIGGIFGIGFPNPLTGSLVFQKLIKQALEANPNAPPRTNVAITDAFVSALPSQGPFISRLVANGQLKEPMFTVTLQREDIEVGGNVGQFTIGQLPDGVSNDSLTWVPVRLYTPAQGGLSGPTSNPSEIYPSRWEIPVDDVMLNGQTLPKPPLQNGTSYTALIDSGTSFLAGPQNVVSSIYTNIAAQGASASSSSTPAISCSMPVDLTYVIGGKPFPVDPRDFLSQQEDVDQCEATYLLPTDAPSTGRMMSWLLGDPFMKSNLVAFYFGNLTHPSVDPPRMGFLSTVPSNANDLLSADVKSAQATGGFVAASVTAPAGPAVTASTAPNGVGQASAGVNKNAASSLQAPFAAVVIMVMSLCSFL